MSTDLKKFNVLYVDDEESNLQGFKSIYFREHNVFVAISAKVALDILSKHEIHIIITDQKMPEMSGVELLNQVVTKYPDPIRIILTGYSDLEVIINAINSVGIFRYMTKPWQVGDMTKIIDQGLETYKLRRQNEKLLNDLKEANEQLEEKVKERTQEVLAQKSDLIAEQKKVHEQADRLKSLNESLTLLNESLESKVNERTSELEGKNLELKMKNKILEEYAFINAHKLRSPVATVLGLIMLFENTNVNENERVYIVEKIKSHVIHLNEVTKEIRRSLENDKGIIPEHTTTEDKIDLRADHSN